MIQSYNPYSLLGKIILVTGASSGIGKVIAIECSKLGAKLIITGRNYERLYETLSLLSGDGHLLKAFDLNNYDATSSFISGIHNLDGVVFCAATQQTSPTKYIRKEDIQKIFETNLFSTINLNALILENKKLNRGASMVFISSVAAGIVAENGNAMYSASKGALSSFAKVLALELSLRKVRVNCVMPGMIKTELLKKISVDSDQFDLDEKRYPFGYGDPLDVAYSVIYFLSDAAKWITGVNLLLDGGLTLK
jgi:NAD(P)-dependent dehydrogenase (short-subunit alcohol dehydrogenase family)